MSNFFEEAKELIEQHPEQAEQALKAAEGLVNKQTGGQYESQISEGAEKLEGMLGIDKQQ